MRVRCTRLVYFVGILIYCFGGIFSVVMLYVNYKGVREIPSITSRLPLCEGVAELKSTRLHIVQ